MTDTTPAPIGEDAALAAIDRELGLPDDGCNSTAQTLNAIRLLKMAHRDDVKVATDLKGENAVLAGLLRDCDAVLATMGRIGNPR